MSKATGIATQNNNDKFEFTKDNLMLAEKIIKKISKRLPAKRCHAIARYRSKAEQ